MLSCPAPLIRRRHAKPRSRQIRSARGQFFRSTAESSVKPGGLLVINSSIIDRKSVRDDIKVVYCDAMGIAESVGNPKGANVAILGAMLEKEPIVSLDTMVEAIRIELGERKQKFLEGNKKALVAGMEAARG